MKTDPGLAVFPSWENVANTFQRHFKHYWQHGSGENAVVGLRAEGSVTLQYAGRVVYELFQNALDQKGNSRAVVRFDGHTLIVGNDGQGISIDPNYDYQHPKLSEARSDFHALCSLHTSNKNADRQFGNKGIGFRSVFGITNKVRLWSRLDDGGWWGLELQEHLIPEEWAPSVMPELDTLVQPLGLQPRPSFHFPRPLRSTEDPFANCDGLNTIITLEVDNEDHRQQIATEIARLKETRFQFIQLRRSRLAFSIDDVELTSQQGWQLDSNDLDHLGFKDLHPLACAAQHPIPSPRIAVAWCNHEVASNALEDGLFYNHLPTRMRTGLPIDIHGDFQVKADRETMSMEADSDVGKYNLALLDKAVASHFRAIQQELEKESPRPDFWLFANRPSDVSTAWISLLRKQLFPNDSFEVWLQLAHKFFTVESSERSSEEFWRASTLWIETLTGCGQYSQRWAKKARELCDLLSAAETPVLPVSTEQGNRLVALPSRQTLGFKAERRVFFCPPDDEDGLLQIPQVLMEAGHAITKLALGNFEVPAGIQRFTPSELLPTLRQIPNDPDEQRIDHLMGAEAQGQLLRFAFALFKRMRDQRVTHFAWRAFSESEVAQSAGRAVATMYLLNNEGTWEPARQLSEDQIDLLSLRSLMGLNPEETLEGFFRFLGVAPMSGVPILEGGKDGVVKALSSPPYPQMAGKTGGKPIPPLRPVVPPGEALHTVMVSVRDIGNDNSRSDVRRYLRSTQWLHSSLFHVFEGVPPLDTHIAPADVVLHKKDPQRIFFAVPKVDADHQILDYLGASNAPDDEKNADRIPHTIKGLQSRIPDPKVLPPSTALSLASLYNRLLRIVLLEGDESIPILYENSGQYAWANSGTDIWIARIEDRQEIRRFFRDVSLLAAEPRAMLPERLGVKPVRLHKKVQPAASLSIDSSLAKDIRNRITPYLPVFAAVAEQTRLVMGQLSESRIQHAWHGQIPIVEVDDAWVEINLEGPIRDAKEWRKDEYDDVFHLPGSRAEDPGVVIFDVSRNEDGTPKTQIPLRYFGDALAVLLMNNANLGSHFAQVLASIDENRISDFIKRHYLEALVQEWTKKLTPLSSEQQNDIEKCLEPYCVDPHKALIQGRIGKKDLRSDLQVKSCRELEQNIIEKVAPSLTPFLPSFQIASENESEWRQWYTSHESRLAALIAAKDGLPINWRKELATLAHRSLDAIDFSPNHFVTTVLQQWGLKINDLPSELEQMTPRFAAVSEAPKPLASLGWKAGQGRSGTGKGGPHRRITEDDIVDESIAKTLIGDAAELALLKWVVRQVKPYTRQSGFKEALLSALPANTKTYAEVAKALETEEFERALHISNLWSGAGFDVLGVSVDTTGKLIPIRYECKGISSDSPKIAVHLSRNELAIAKQVRRHGPGHWTLVGVQPSGICADMTELVAPLIEDGEAPLLPLYELGVEPDGVRIIVTRSPKQALT